MIWFFILGLIFCGWGGYFLIDFIKNNKKLYEVFSKKEGIPVSYYRQIIAAILGVIIGISFIIKFVKLLVQTT